MNQWIKIKWVETKQKIKKRKEKILWATFIMLNLENKSLFCHSMRESKKSEFTQQKCLLNLFFCHVWPHIHLQNIFTVSQRKSLSLHLIWEMNFSISSPLGRESVTFKSKCHTECKGEIQTLRLNDTMWLWCSAPNGLIMGSQSAHPVEF